MSKIAEIINSREDLRQEALEHVQALIKEAKWVNFEPAYIDEDGHRITSIDTGYVYVEHTSGDYISVGIENLSNVDLIQIAVELEK